MGRALLAVWAADPANGAADPTAATRWLVICAVMASLAATAMAAFACVKKPPRHDPNNVTFYGPNGTQAHGYSANNYALAVPAAPAKISDRKGAGLGVGLAVGAGVGLAAGAIATAAAAGDDRSDSGREGGGTGMGVDAGGVGGGDAGGGGDGCCVGCGGGGCGGGGCGGCGGGCGG